MNNHERQRLQDHLREWQDREQGKRHAVDIARQLLSSAATLRTSKDIKSAGLMIHEFLNQTGQTSFLRVLDETERTLWVEVAFRFVRYSAYSLNVLLASRVKQYPQRVLFQDMSSPIPAQWTYAETDRHVREIAGALYSLTNASGQSPRVAIYAENHLETACSDLACLLYDILNTPLDPHLRVEELQVIFDRLAINLAITDTANRAAILEEVRTRTKQSFQIIISEPGFEALSDRYIFLGSLCKSLNIHDIEVLLTRRKRFKLNETATVMFTSGSTGVPKGVSFSIYQLVVKRLARAAALPAVGDNEVLLCYLPLYHTFGRYFEMLGVIFWGGTYVFTGNPSAETMLAQFPKINPTGFISVPIRWHQLYEKCLETLDGLAADDEHTHALQSVIGKKLRWGLSAAGYLDPRVFRFFERIGVSLCSGFGMTEGTGGITMTVPGRYEDNTHGLPLPGIRTRLADNGELQVSGHYIARYLDDKGPGDIIPYPGDPIKDYWLNTGDVFRILENGYFQIVDRIKDIYKNNRGQTIAPRKVESKFACVPGIKRAFLIGDGRPHNVLLIVPDDDDEVLRKGLNVENASNYYRRIVSAANQDLAPHERVINLTVLKRDFDQKRGELTPKGSFNRKTIEDHFRDSIDELYRSNQVCLVREDIRVLIPLWFYRDLGILEDELVLDADGVINIDCDHRLTIKRTNESGVWLVGDLEYSLNSDVLDLGLFARQPLLWAGNPALIRFCPCKDGWDVPLKSISDRVVLPIQGRAAYTGAELSKMSQPGEPELQRLNILVCLAFFATPDEATAALEEIEQIFGESENLRISTLLRRRLEALSRHPEERVRCWAYRLLLLDDPNPGYGEFLPTFLYSSLTFLNEESITKIVSSRFGHDRFNLLRQRMMAYRQQLDWPVSESHRRQFINVFRLFIDFTKSNPAFHDNVRAELAAWILHRTDPVLAEAARSGLDELQQNIDHILSVQLKPRNNDNRAPGIIYEESLNTTEISKLHQIITAPLFLNQSIFLAYDGASYDPSDIGSEGIWVTRINAATGQCHYRIMINTLTGRHFDLRLVYGIDCRSPEGLETVFWLLSLADHPKGRRILPRIGAWSPDLGAVSWRYSSDPTAWEKIREFASRRETESGPPPPQTWRKLFIDAFTAFFRATDYSNFRIIPGLVSPTNIIVSEVDFREEAIITSLGGHRPYTGPQSLVKPMFDNFYRRTRSGYPWTANLLDVSWIFDACYEAFGRDKAESFLLELKKELQANRGMGPDVFEISHSLEQYLDYFNKNFIVPLLVLNAINKFKEWLISHGLTTHETRERKLLEIFHQFQLGRYPEIIRYYFYRHTYFASLDEHVSACFDRLLKRMMGRDTTTAVQLIELSDLQATLNLEADRRVFSRMVFPGLPSDPRLDVLKIGDQGNQQIVVHSRIRDTSGTSFTMSQTMDPAEIGHIYRLFFKENFPKVISEQDRHYVVKDDQGRVVGGLCYHLMYHNMVFIDAIVVNSTNKQRGLGRAIINDFCGRMASQNISVVVTHFFLPAFFLKAGFKSDKRWGALVRFL